MSKNLLRLDPKKRDVGLQKLSRIIGVDRWLAMINAPEDEMLRVAADWPLSDRYAFDAPHILGLGSRDATPLPRPKKGELIIRYGGWSLEELRDSRTGRKLMPLPVLYKYDWKSFRLPAGMYCLRIPTLKRNDKALDEQARSLPKGEKPAPVVLVATALLCHQLEEHADLLKGGKIFCKETHDGLRATLLWVDDHLSLSPDLDVNRQTYQTVGGLESLDHIRLASFRAA